MKRFLPKGRSLPLLVGTFLLSVASVFAIDPTEHVRTRTSRNLSDYSTVTKGRPQLRTVTAPSTQAPEGPRTNLPAQVSKEGTALQERVAPRTQVAKQIARGHDTPEFVDVKKTEPETKGEGSPRVESSSLSPERVRGERPAIVQQTGGPRLVSDRVPSPNRDQCGANEACRADRMALEEGLTITRKDSIGLNSALVFNSEGYLGMRDYIASYDTYRNLGVLADWVGGSSYAYVYSIDGYLDYETDVKDYMTGGNLALIRNNSNRVYLYRTTGYAGYLDGITSYTVGHNIAILRNSNLGKVYVYTYQNGLVDTLTVSNPTMRAGDNVALVLSGSGTAYLYNQNGYMDYETGISNYSVGGNMAIVRTSGGTAYIYSDLGYQDYEVSIADYQAGGDMSVLRNGAGTTFTYKYNGFLYADSSVYDYWAGETLATVLKNNDTAYTYKFGGYYADTNVNDFSVGGAMAVVRTWSNNAYIYSDLTYVSSDVNCVNFATGGFMATTKVSSGTMYTYSDMSYLGSTSNGMVMAPGGGMTVTKSSSGQVKVWNLSGVIDSFTGGIVDFIAGQSMSAVRSGPGGNYTTYVYNRTAYLDSEPYIQDYRVAGLFANSGGTIGISNNQTLLPNEFSLEQNYPNPFNPSTTIRFTIGKMANVKVTVYDLTGRLVTTLVDQRYAAGTHALEWNASNLASGTYLYRVQAGDLPAQTKKMVLVK